MEGVIPSWRFALKVVLVVIAVRLIAQYVPLPAAVKELLP